jgi:ribonuclease R
MEKSHALVGERTRAMYRIADRIRVKVAAVNEARKQVEFALIGTLEKRPVAAAQQGENYPSIPIRGKRPKPKRR